MSTAREVLVVARTADARLDIAARCRKALGEDLEVIHASTLKQALDAHQAKRPIALVVTLALRAAGTDSGGLDVIADIAARGRRTRSLLIVPEPDMRLIRCAYAAGAAAVALRRELDDEGVWASVLPRVSETSAPSSGVDWTPRSPPSDALDSLLGSSPVMCSLKRMIVKCGAAPHLGVLVLGDTGTGKELVARAIHETSPLAPEPFIAVNCASVAPTLFESLCFGHEAGAFTGAIKEHRGFFERAGRGTLFLDEVAELPMDLQAKLLRVHEQGTFFRVGGEAERTFNGRIVAATNRNLARMVDEGVFRSDLYHRLKSLCVRVPRLQERTEDIRELVGWFSRSEPRRLQFTESALMLLEAASWAGNVRELRAVVAAASATADGCFVDVNDVRLVLTSGDHEDAAPSVRTREDVARLASSPCGTRAAAARELGISRHAPQRILTREAG